MKHALHIEIKKFSSSWSCLKQAHLCSLNVPHFFLWEMLFLDQYSSNLKPHPSVISSLKVLPVFLSKINTHSTYWPLCWAAILHWVAAFLVFYGFMVRDSFLQVNAQVSSVSIQCLAGDILRGHGYISTLTFSTYWTLNLKFLLFPFQLFPHNSLRLPTPSHKSLILLQKRLGDAVTPFWLHHCFFNGIIVSKNTKVSDVMILFHRDYNVFINQFFEKFIMDFVPI